MNLIADEYLLWILDGCSYEDEVEYAIIKYI